MARRLHKTLIDYVVIAISPALIMLLVGSLVFFLLTVFYHGQYEARLHFIFAMFIMATVLIARISMEEGVEYAMLFAAPLAVTAGLAMFRFVAIQGPWATQSWLFNWALLGIVWWSAHKLTWDCTLIDEEEDASGEGLVQTARLEDTSREIRNDDHAPQQPPATDALEWSPRQLWRRFVEKQRRPHAPGVWVVYFSVAALLLFGFGQLFIPSSDLGTRRYAFRLLCIYVASGLALLVTTSFLGLRRYLRQRHVEMPGPMTQVWLTVGGVMIVVLMLFCSLLPRPNAEYAVSQAPFQLGSPTDLRSSRVSVGRSGSRDDQQAKLTRTEKEEDDGTSSENETAPHEDTNRQRPSGNQQVKDEQNDSTRRSAPPSERRPASEQREEHDLDGDQSSSTPPSQSATDSRRPDQSESGSHDKQPSRTSRDSSVDPQDTESSNRNIDETNDGKDARVDSESRSGEEGRDKQPPPDGRVPTEPSETYDERPTSDRADRSDQRRTPPRDESSPREPRQTDDSDRSRTSSGAQDSSTGAAPKWRSPSRLLGTLTSAIGGLLKLLFYAAVAAIVIFLVWSHWAQIKAAWSQFLRELSALWSAMFGRRTSSAETETEIEAAKAPPPRPFSDYVDPFASGTADRYSPRELVRYSFEAMEAWAREHGCAREPDQTPHEFAQRVAARQRPLLQDAQNLATLYARAAYSPTSLAPSSAQSLQSLWRQLGQGPAMQ